MVVWNSPGGTIELFWMDENGTKSPSVDYIAMKWRAPFRVAPPLLLPPHRRRMLASR
jgi:hypothetical protein